MTDVAYGFGPFGVPVRIRATDGSFGGTLGPKDTYVHVSDPGMEFIVTNSDTRKRIGIYPTTICRHGKTEPHEGDVKVDGKWRSWICIPGGLPKKEAPKNG